ncbi:MAG: hypothetical protein QW550_03200 [Saccharolobus sp.]
MDDIAQNYLKDRISISLPILNISVPCNTTCLIMSKYKDLLNIEVFKSQIEILDSLINLIEDNIFTLKREIEDKFSNYTDYIDTEGLTYTIYKIIEEGGNTVIGDKKIYFGEKEIASGDFSTLMNINRLIEKLVKEDSNIRSLCDQIKYLSESTWEHFDKNISKVLSSLIVH